MNPFKPARFYSRGRFGSTTWLLVVHSMQTPETPGRAKQVWNWFTGRTSPQSSAHYLIDNTSVLSSVKLSDTAWAVDKWRLNTGSISYELAGMAEQTEAQWNDPYSKAERALLVRTMVADAHKFGIPLRRLTPAQIAALAARPSGKVHPSEGGICGHADITAAMRIAGGHTDPGQHFPWDTLVNELHTEAARMVASSTVGV